jgi:hypothetical protein
MTILSHVNSLSSFYRILYLLIHLWLKFPFKLQFNAHVIFMVIITHVQSTKIFYSPYVNHIRGNSALLLHLPFFKECPLMLCFMSCFLLCALY